MTIRQQYRKVRKRLTNLISSYKRKGYDVEYSLPAIPKRPTRASIRRLEKITVKDIREKTYAADIETGEKVTYQRHKTQLREYKKKEKQRREKVYPDELVKPYIPTMWELALDRIYEIIDQYDERIGSLFKAKILSAISVYGAMAVGMAIEQMIENGEIVTPSESYNYEAVIEMSNALMRYLSFNDDETKQVKSIMNEINDSVEEFEGEFDSW